jgi:hypothetical protein
MRNKMMLLQLAAVVGEDAVRAAELKANREHEAMLKAERDKRISEREKREERLAIN